MNLTFRKVIVLLLSVAVLPFAAAESFNAKTVHEAEQAGTFDINKVVLRGDSEGEK